MKVFKLVLVVAFVMGTVIGCGGGGAGGGGGGGATFDDCVKAGMDNIAKQTGQAAPAEAKGPVEQGCQICKDKPGSDECKMIIKGMSGQVP